MEAVGFWWVPRTSNPVWGASSVLGRFDSCALPPFFRMNPRLFSLDFVSQTVPQELWNRKDFSPVDAGDDQGFQAVYHQDAILS